MSEPSSTATKKRLIIAGAVIGLILLVVAASCTLLSPIETESETKPTADSFVVPPSEDDEDSDDDDLSTSSPRDPSDTSADEGGYSGDGEQPGADYSAAGDPDSYTEAGDDSPYIPDPEQSDEGDDDSADEPVDVPSESPNPTVDDPRPDPGEDDGQAPGDDGRDDGDAPGDDNGRGDDDSSGDDGGEGPGDNGPGDDGPGDDEPTFPEVSPGDVLTALNDIRAERGLDPFTGSGPTPEDDYEDWATDPLLAKIYRSQILVTDGNPADELRELVKNARDAQHLLRSDLPIGAIPVLGVETRETADGIEVEVTYEVRNTVAPEAVDDSVIIPYDPEDFEPTVIDVLENDRIIDSSTDVQEALSITVKPLQGSAEVVDGAIVYTPPSNPLSASDVLHYTVTDLQGRTSRASVSISLELVESEPEPEPTDEPSPPEPTADPRPEPTVDPSPSPTSKPPLGLGQPAGS